MIEMCARCGMWCADDPDDLEDCEDFEYVLCEYCVLEMADLFYFDEVEVFTYFLHNEHRFNYIASDLMETLT